MNREEKITLAHFLDLAGDCLGDGHARPRAEYHFEDDTPAEKPGSSFSSLPLAYQIDENPEAAESRAAIAARRSLRSSHASGFRDSFLSMALG